MQKLVGDAERDVFGSGVAISQNGAVMAVTAPSASFGGRSGAGAAYVYRANGSEWDLESKVGSDTGSIGTPLALSPNGQILTIFDGPSRTVLTREFNGTHWPIADTFAAIFGGTVYAFALSADGAVCVHGEVDDYRDDGDNSVVVVHRRAPGSSTWSREAVIAGTGTTYFGYSVDLSHDGNILLCGAPGASTSTDVFGKAFVYEHLGGSAWSQVAELVPPANQVGKRFPLQTALSASGEVAVFGASDFDTNSSIIFSGATFVFENRPSEGGWVFAAELSVPVGELHFFGGSVDITDDGLSIISSAPREDDRLGAVYLFNSDGSSTYCEPGTSPFRYCGQCPSDTFSNGTAACSECPANSFTTPSGMAVTVDDCACTEGTFFDSISTTCVECDAGSWSNVSGATSPSTCTACVSGRFSATSGASAASACLLCPTPNATSAAGSSICDVCTPGFFGGICDACPDCGPNGACLDGAARNGSCECDPFWTGDRCDVSSCPGGQLCNSTDGTSTACPAGFACNNSTFVPCPTTNVTSNVGSSVCDVCTSGYFGLDCSLCPVCGPNGACLDGATANGSCECDPFWTGDRCDVSSCPGGQLCNSTDGTVSACPAGFVCTNSTAERCTDVDSFCLENSTVPSRCTECESFLERCRGESDAVCGATAEEGAVERLAGSLGVLWFSVAAGAAAVLLILFFAFTSRRLYQFYVRKKNNHLTARGAMKNRDEELMTADLKILHMNDGTGRLRKDAKGTKNVYRVFQSHRSDDTKPLVRAVHYALENVGISSFIDSEALLAQEIPAGIYHGVLHCDVLVAWLSKGVNSSPWVKREILMAFENEPQPYSKLTVSVFYDVTPGKMPRVLRLRNNPVMESSMGGQQVFEELVRVFKSVCLTVGERRLAMSVGGDPVEAVRHGLASVVSAKKDKYSDTTAMRMVEDAWRWASNPDNATVSPAHRLSISRLFWRGPRVRAARLQQARPPAQDDLLQD